MSDNFSLAVDHFTPTTNTTSERTISSTLVGRLDDWHDDVARNARRGIIGA
jgi:hypothetical protein